MLYGDSAAAAPQITQFNANSNHELFIALSDLITKHVARAWQIPLILAGIETPGKLGSSNEIANATELYYSTIIKDDVNFITGILNDLITQMPGYDGTKLSISNSIPIRYIPDQVIQYLDPATILKYYGFDPVNDLKKEGGDNASVL
jgi:hypothetical protein